MSVHPSLTIAEMRRDELETLAADVGFVTSLETELGDLDRLVATAQEPRIAYLSLEFGLTATVPLYAGGLGVLAGDHIKAASDLGKPLVGVGLFYRHGIFRQVIEGDEQEEYYTFAGPEDYGATDTGVVIRVPLPGRDVAVRVWRLDVGRIPLILLDTYVSSNTERDREIADRLYIGFTNERVSQEMVLGVGGARALEALGYSIEAYHLNEGHAGFINLELIDRVIADGKIGAAVAKNKATTIFTTHTPVPAGIDRFDRSALVPFFEPWTNRWGADIDALWALGQDSDDPSRFNMAGFCLNTSGAANGVSELHGEVSRQLFAGVGIGDRIGHVTNGVHARTWAAPHIQRMFDDALGATWSEGDSQAWERVSELDLDRVGQARAESSLLLSSYIASNLDHPFDPDALVVGFARRFVPYKRATLFMSDLERLETLLSNDDRPVQFVFAGKAHPNDQRGKNIVSELIRFSKSRTANGRVLFIPDYNMDVGHAMVKGSDIWLNNPVRPREASGTSGEKVALNGGLNLSILDGWWAEMFDGSNGWEIRSSDSGDPAERDIEESGWLLDRLEDVVEEYFGNRDRFHQRIIHAWATLGPKVTAARMVDEYDQKYYGPALSESR